MGRGEKRGVFLVKVHRIIIVQPAVYDDMPTIIRNDKREMGWIGGIEARGVRSKD